MHRWRITIEAWPHSSGKGQTADQALAGERVQTYEIDAQTIAEALKLADCIARGICSNPAVWQAPIFGIIRVTPF